MVKRFFGTALVFLVILIASCTVTVAPVTTTIEAENDLTNIANISGISTTIDRIDLYNVTIGDIVFPHIAGGTNSSDYATQSFGTVDIYIDSAVGYVNGHGIYLFTNIPSSTVDLSSGNLNIVHFGKSSLSGASVSVRQTKVEVENDLTNLSVDVAGATTNVTAIDLAGVTVGDAFFSFVEGGTTSSTQVTGSSGSVTVTIDTAYVWTNVLGVSFEVPLTNIAAMTAQITPGTINTIVFDQTTASVIFNALAKRKAKQR
jgi:hypothetical protein